MAKIHVPGKDKGKIMLYALSTCPWCGKTKRLLGEMGVGYEFEDVDLLEGDARQQSIHEVSHWNPDASFPVLVIDNKRSIVGFREDEIRKALA